MPDTKCILHWACRVYRARKKPGQNEVAATATMHVLWLKSYGYRLRQLRYHWLVEDAHVIPVAIRVLLVALSGSRWCRPGPFLTTKALVVVAFGYEKLLEVRSTVELSSADCIAFQPEMTTAVTAAKAVLVHPQSAHLHSLHGVEFFVAYSACLRVGSSWKLLQTRAPQAWNKLQCKWQHKIFATIVSRLQHWWAAPGIRKHNKIGCINFILSKTSYIIVLHLDSQQVQKRFIEFNGNQVVEVEFTYL